MANTIQIKRTPNSTVNDDTVVAGELVWKDNHADAGGANGSLYIGDTDGDLRHIGGVGSGAVAGIINNATANELVTVASTTSELDAESTLTYNTADGLGLSTTAADVPFTLTNTETTYSSQPHIKMVKNGANVEDNERLGKLSFHGDDSAGNVTQYGEMEFLIYDTTATDESGKMHIRVATSDGTNTSLKNSFTSTGHPTGEYVDTTIGYSTDSTCTVTGDLAAQDINGKIITAQTNFVPDAADGAGLGTAALEFSDLFLANGAVINLGTDQDVTLTHVHDTGLLLNSAMVMQFRDSAISIGSGADAALDLTSDGSIDMNVGAAGVIIKGTTPKLTIGDAASEDTFLVFDGQAQDYRIGLDDGTDKLEFGVGSAHGTTTAMTIDANQQVKITATTASSSSTTGALIVAGSVGVAGDVTIGDDIVLPSDSAAITLGNDKEIELSHVHNKGLKLRNTSSSDNRPAILLLESTENAVVLDEVIGVLDFKAGGVSAGQDSILVAAGIEAVAEGTFGTASNATKLSFKTAASEVAAEKMSLSSAGVLTVSSNIVGGGTYSGGGLMTTGGNVVIPNAGTIGSASSTSALAIASTGDVTIAQDLLVSGSLNVTGSVVEIDSTSMVVKDKELWVGVPGGVIEKVYSRSNGTTTATITSASHGLDEGDEVLIVGAAGTQDGIYTILSGGSFASGVFEITTTETSAISAQPVWHSVSETTDATADGAGLYVAGNTTGGDPAGAASWYFDYSPSPAWETKIGIRVDARDSGAAGFHVLNPLAGTDVGRTISDFDGTHTGVESNHAQLTVLGNTTTTSSNTPAENNTTGLLVAPQGNAIPASKTATVVSSAAFFEPVISLGSGSAVTNAATVYIASVPTEGANNYALYGTGAIGGFTIDGGTF